MGSNNSKPLETERQNYYNSLLKEDKSKNSQEENTIKDIAKLELKQKILVFGNYNENFFTNNLVVNLRGSDGNSNYIKVANHTSLKGWNFYFFAENDKNVAEKVYSEIEKSYKTDPNSKKKQRVGDYMTILYFYDEYHEGIMNYFFSQNQLFLPLFIILGQNTTEFKQFQENNESTIKNKCKKISKNILKYGILSDNEMINLYTILNLLIETASYYNETGDEFKMPKQLMNLDVMSKDVELIIKYCYTINILVLGRPGAGKSNLINYLVNSMVCKSGEGNELSSRILKYYSRLHPLSFYDTPGMSTDSITKEIIKLILQKNKELNNIGSKIHAVFYMINGHARYFQNNEKKMLEFLIADLKLPVYFVVSKLEDEEELEERMDIIKGNFDEITKESINELKREQNEEILKYFERFNDDNFKTNCFLVNVIGKHFVSPKKLFKKIYEDFKKYIIQTEINSENLSRITENSLIGKINKPKDIKSNVDNLCDNIISLYRIIGSSIKWGDLGSTNLSMALIKEISTIYGIDKVLSLQECRDKIQEEGYSDEYQKNPNERYFQKFFANIFYDSPANKEMKTLGGILKDEYGKKFSNPSYCIRYINKMRKAINESIEDLKNVE